MALDVANDIVATVVRTAIEYWLFGPKDKGKIRNELSRAERIERIYDWREANGRG